MKKILLIKIGALGDILMTTPALRALKKSHAEAHISLLVGATVKEIIERNPYIDEFIEVDDKIFFRGSFWQKLKLLWGLRACVRAGNYDTAVILHRDGRYGLFTALCGISERVGFQKNSWGDMFLTQRARIKGITHHIYHYLELVKQLGAVPDGDRMDFSIRETASKKAEQILSAHGLRPDRLIGISAGGAQNVKEVMNIRKWPAKKYAQLIGLLKENKFDVILLGAKTDTYLLSELPSGPRVLNAIGESTLEETAAIMKRCQLIVTHDSGPMHLASAVGVPVVSLFGPTDPREKYPLNDNSHYFWDNQGLECVPCYRNGVFPQCQTAECMQKIKVADVYNKILEIMESRPVSKGYRGAGSFHGKETAGQTMALFQEVDEKR